MFLRIGALYSANFYPTMVSRDMADNNADVLNLCIRIGWTGMQPEAQMSSFVGYGAHSVPCSGSLLNHVIYLLLKVQHRVKSEPKETKFFFLFQRQSPAFSFSASSLSSSKSTAAFSLDLLAILSSQRILNIYYLFQAYPQRFPFRYSFPFVFFFSVLF